MAEPEMNPTMTIRESPTLAELAAALAEAQGEYPAIVRRKTAEIKSDKGNYKYSYADLAAVLAIVTPINKKHGLSVIQRPCWDGARLSLETRILHKSGEWINGLYPLPTIPKPQDMGSALTYARRYSLTSMLGIASEEDDDGALASKREGGAGKQAEARVSESALADHLANIEAATDAESLKKAFGLAWNAAKGDRSAQKQFVSAQEVKIASFKKRVQ